MDWMDVRQVLSFTANKLSYKIFHTKKLELLRHRFFVVRPKCTNNTRLSGPSKMGPRPSTVGRTQVTKNQYRSKAYDFFAEIPDEIQKLSKIDHFTKWLIFFYKYGATQPSDYLPRFDN